MVLPDTSKTLGAVLGTATVPVAKKWLDTRFVIPGPLGPLKVPSRFLSLGAGALMAIYAWAIKREVFIPKEFAEMFAVTALTNGVLDIGLERMPAYARVRVAAPTAVPTIVTVPPPAALRAGVSVF